MKRFPLMCAVLVLATIAPAQTLSVTVSPNPAPLGTPVTVTAQSLVPGLFTPFGCLLTSVRSGMPGGPIVAIFPCTFLPVAIPLCGGTTFRTGTWTPAGSVPAGNYWIEIQHQPQMFGGPVTTEWHSVTIEDTVNAPVPALAAVTMPTWGSAFTMSLSMPTAPFSPYGVALSATTNTGIASGGGHVALDADDLFFLSLSQDPAFFVNFSGNLDASGVASSISLLIPAITGIPCLPLHAQAVVFIGTPFTLSNCLNFTIK